MNKRKEEYMHDVNIQWQAKKRVRDLELMKLQFWSTFCHELARNLRQVILPLWVLLSFIICNAEIRLELQGPKHL